MQDSLNTDTRITLPVFDDARPLGPEDETFINEISDVLVKHGNLERFGLCLLHDHFRVTPGEILLETHDQEARTLSLEVVKSAELIDAKPTSWYLRRHNDSEVDRTAIAMTKCAEDKCKVVPVAMTACAEDKCK